MNATASLINKFVTYVIDPLMLMIFAAGFFFFMYGFVEFIWGMRSGAVSDKAADSKRHMVYGVIGMVIMVSVGGILNFIAGTFGLDLTGNNINASSINNVNVTGFQ